uniref:Uncharacterized protein n=1 Tax=Anopheles farauti TaxID=69004 RepID=A0A182QZ34_9DIPT
MEPATLSEVSVTVLSIDAVDVHTVPIGVDARLDPDAPYQTVHVTVRIQLIRTETHQLRHRNLVYVHTARGHVQQLQLIQGHKNTVMAKRIEAVLRTVDVLRVGRICQKVACQLILPQTLVIAPEAGVYTDAPQQALCFTVAHNHTGM